MSAERGNSYFKELVINFCIHHQLSCLGQAQTDEIFLRRASFFLPKQLAEIAAVELKYIGKPLNRQFPIIICLHISDCILDTKTLRPRILDVPSSSRGLDQLVHKEAQIAKQIEC